MQMITITGKQALHGRIRPAAAKNSTLPLLAATLLCRGPCRLQEVPALADVTTSLALLQAVGADVRRCGADLCTRPVQTLCGEIPESLAGAMRSSVFTLRRCSAAQGMCGCRCPAAAVWGRGRWISIWPDWPPWGPRSSWRALP